jgi:guanylate kinase
MKTRMIVVAAPSGAGKSSFVERISQEDARLVDVITYTTRPQRKGESQGRPYYFVTEQDFHEKIGQGFFVEWALVHNRMYGTSHEELEKAWSQQKCVIMDVDVQGTVTFKGKFPDAVSIFILPPSIDELRRRIIKRDGGVPADIELRMQNAEREIKEAFKFDHQIVNDVFETSYAEFKKIVEKLLG